MIRLPDQNRSYGSSMKFIAALPLILVVAVGATVLIYFAFPGVLSKTSAPPAPSSREGTPSAQSADATLLYPGATDVIRQSGTVSSMVKADPISAGMAAQVSDAAKKYGSAPIVSTRFGTEDRPSTVLQWYDGVLRGGGWCAPSSVNANVDLHVYLRAQRDAFALIVLPVPSLTGGHEGSSVITSYLELPDTGVLPAC